MHTEVWTGGGPVLPASMLILRVAVVAVPHLPLSVKTKISSKASPSPSPSTSDQLVLSRSASVRRIQGPPGPPPLWVVSPVFFAIGLLSSVPFASLLQLSLLVHLSAERSGDVGVH